MTTSARTKIFGLLAAALVAWVLTVVFDLAPMVLVPLTDRIFGAEIPTGIDPVQLRNIITLYAAFGLPIAVPFVLIAGYPVWKRSESRGRTHKRDAIWLGAIVGLLLGLAFAAYIFVYGLQTMADPNSSFNSWSYGYQMTADGMPTALGWAFQLLDIVLTAITGAAAGLTAWTVATLMEARRRPA
ncbi:hypothetical protein GCM10009116_05920 [Brevundimonas basaltis]|uniref:Uncharacterized protein n=1 Tax=Brevundimonas basaltis TaxID=472166 RepID=A0A7W8I0D5_9CAUL|nr:hypothetical protein [Brevundimonas basaltis]MBB5293135.1 hypothetical protein [Brevundimonas basaltis]